MGRRADVVAVEHLAPGGVGRTRSAVAAAWVVLAPVLGQAAPNLSLDDPVYLELARLRAEGRLPPYLGGFRLLTETRAQLLLRAAGAAAEPRLLAADEDGWWLRPLAEARLRLAVADEEARPYSTPVHPRDLVGSVSLACEHQEGRPCGDGVRLALELDSSAGHGTWLAFFARTRLGVGSEPYGAEAALDRGYAHVELGPVQLEAGRDVLGFGPGVHTQLMWGDQPAPLDHVRVGTAQPVDLLGTGGSVLRASAQYFLGRLAAPQRFPGTLVEGGRLQFDLLDALEAGATHLVELGGDGAPAIDFGDVLLENFHRKQPAGTAGISNHRLAFDVALAPPWLPGARVYYEVAFEDTRNQFFDAWRYDADHLLGVELASLHGIVVEYLHTGFRSEEHDLWTSGFTQAGRVAGAPLGPDAWSLYAEGRLELPSARFWPWIELARLSSDRWVQDDSGIHDAAAGATETRLRLGGRLGVIRPPFRLEVRAFFEHVDGLGFDPARTREQLGASAALVWSPGLVVR